MKPAQFSDPLNIVDKHGEKIEVRIMFLDGERGWERKEPFPRGAIVGKAERTRFIVKQLSELLKEPEKQITIYEQSALSTFGISEQRMLWNHAPVDYLELIMEQKKLLKELADQKRTTIKLILRPVLEYEQQWMEARCDALLEWLRSDHPNADFVVVEDYEVQNRFIVKDHFCVDGYKIHDTSGYELSLVRTATHEIKEAMESFDRVFHKLHQTKETVIRYFEQLRKGVAKSDPHKSGLV